MFDWLYNAIYGSGRRIASSILQLVHDVVHGVVGALSSLFGNVFSAWWNMLYAGILAFRFLGSFANSIYVALFTLIKVWLPPLRDAVRYLYGAVAKAVTDAAAYAAHLVEQAAAQAWRWVQDALSWVQRNVYTPLFGRILDIYRTIGKWAQDAYYLVTHPDALARLLFWSLWGVFTDNAWQIGQSMGEWALRLFLANAVRGIKLVETIVTDVL